MAITWVAGTTASYANSAASLNSTTPAGIQDGDTLFAFVRTSSNIGMTPPAGWTEEAVYGAAAGTDYTKVWVFTKDTVTSGNSSTEYTWTPAASAQISVTYAVVRASIGSVRATYYALEEPNTGNASVGFPLVAASRAGSMFLMVGASFYTETGSTSATLSDMPDATYWTGSVDLNLLGGAYWPRGATEDTGSATMLFVGGFIPNNGKVGVVVDMYDTGFEAEVSDTYRVIGELRRTSAYSPVVTDGSVFTPAASVFPRWGGRLTEHVAIGSTRTAAYKGSAIVADSTSVADAPRTASPAGLSDGVTVAEATAVVRAVRVLDALALTPAALGRARYGLAALEALALRDSLRRFFSAEALDATTFAPATLEAIKRPALAGDSLTLTDVLGHTLILRVTAADGLDLTAAEALKLIFRPTVTDGVDIVAGYVAPDGTFTTWAVNTTTAAVTEYTGFEFNSFARMGRRYLAATSGGLYVLDGDTDDGADIIADIKTGAAQFAGSRFSSVKAVYLGLRGDGEFRLNVIAGDGVARTYKVITQSARTIKVQTGKGIRTRYLAFELVSTGQDFDLDTIEIIPLMAQRRV